MPEQEEDRPELPEPYVYAFLPSDFPHAGMTAADAAALEQKRIG